MSNDATAYPPLYNQHLAPMKLYRVAPVGEARNDGRFCQTERTVGSRRLRSPVILKEKASWRGWRLLYNIAAQRRRQPVGK